LKTTNSRNARSGFKGGSCCADRTAADGKPLLVSLLQSAQPNFGISDLVVLDLMPPCKINEELDILLLFYPPSRKPIFYPQCQAGKET